MTESCPKPEKPWREIAEEVAKEHDSDKVAELSQQLIEAQEYSRRSERVPKHDEQRVPS